VIGNIGYDDMGSPGNVEFFGGTAGPAKDLLGQRYDFVACTHAEKVRNHGIETYSLLNVGVTAPAIKYF
jgi:hypothetical protein